MFYTLCSTCGHRRHLQESCTGRPFWVCGNIKCPDRGSQEWVPEPVREEVSRLFLYCIIVILVGIMAIFGYNKIADNYRSNKPIAKASEVGK